MDKRNDVSLKPVMNERNDGLLPFDILVEILSRLPGKQLMRFKCVSKSWFFLITDPAFVELHSSRSYHREDGGVTGVFVSHGAACIFDMKKEPLERVSVFKPSIPYDNNRTTNIVNGLICFYHESYDKRLIYLYNLTSRECISLPSTQVEDHPRRLPFQFSRTCLLGFDPITKEYKVLHFYSHGKNQLKKCQLLTIGAQKSAWRPLDISHIQGFKDFTCKDGFCVDGLLYWTEPNEIIVFDVGREMFKLIRFPQRRTLYCKKSGLVKRHNCLYLVEFYDPPSQNWWQPRSIVEIIWWRLKEGEDTGEPQWSKEVETCEKGSSFGYCFNYLGQMFSAHSSHSDTSIIEYYDLVTGNRQKFEVYNARGILDSSFRATKITDNIMPLRNALQVPEYSPQRENFNVSRGSR